MNNKNFLITILMAALSLIVIFAVSCGDKPTGSTPEDEFISSVPSPTGNPVSPSDSLYNYNTDESKTITLTLIESESKQYFNGTGGGEDFLENYRNNTSYILIISDGLVTFNQIQESSGGEGTPQKYTNKILSNAQLLKKNGDKYNAAGGSDENSKYYIEFKKGEGDNLTDFRFEAACSVKGDSFEYGYKVVCKQQ